MARQEITEFEETPMLWRGVGQERKGDVTSCRFCRLSCGNGCRLEPVADATVLDVGRWRG